MKKNKSRRSEEFQSLHGTRAKFLQITFKKFFKFNFSTFDYFNRNLMFIENQANYKYKLKLNK